MQAFKEARRQLGVGAKLAGFSAVLAAVFSVAALAGAAIDPKGESESEKAGVAHGRGHKAATAPAHGGRAAVTEVVR